MIFFSPSTGGFYAAEIHGSHIPADAVSITTDEHAALLAGQSAGKRIVPDAEGKPTLADAPAPTAAELAAQHKAEIQAQLDALDASSARPLRAIMAAQAAGKTAAAADLTKLADLEAQAVALRAELAGLEA